MDDLTDDPIIGPSLYPKMQNDDVFDSNKTPIRSIEDWPFIADQNDIPLMSVHFDMTVMCSCCKGYMNMSTKIPFIAGEKIGPIICPNCGQEFGVEFVGANPKGEE